LDAGAPGRYQMVTKVVNEKCMTVHLQFVPRAIFSAVRFYSRCAQEYMYL
jgi:hypothetical protein